MRRAIAAMVLLCLPGCGGPAPTAAPPEVKNPDAWLVFSDAASADYAAVNLHETPLGLAGRLVKADGSSAALRQVLRSETTLSFVVPALAASYSAQRQTDGAWTGDWSTAGSAEPLKVVLAPATEPPPTATATASEFVTLPDGRRMHLVCTGEGAPVVLLDYGAGGTMKKDWGELARAAAASTQTRVCAYDRAGRGLSDVGAMPRDAAAVVSDIDGMLAAANIPAPYVLVGHSMGSYHVRLFANTHADKTAGLVLVDPSGDGQTVRFNAAIPKVQAIQDADFKARADLNCITRLREKLLAPDDPLSQQCGGNDPEAIDATKSEIESMPGASTGQLTQSRRSYGDMPLIVLTRGDYEKGMPPGFTAEDRVAMRTVWETMHAEMAALSTAGEHRFIAGAGHYIQGDNPQAVIDAITAVVAKARLRK